MCHDHVDVGWAKLADMKIVDDQLVGCAYNQAFCSVWIAEVQKIRPFSGNDYPADLPPASESVYVQPPVQPTPTPEAPAYQPPQNSHDVPNSNAVPKVPTTTAASPFGNRAPADRRAPGGMAFEVPNPLAPPTPAAMPTPTSSARQPPTPAYNNNAAPAAPAYQDKRANVPILQAASNRGAPPTPPPKFNAAANVQRAQPSQLSQQITPTPAAQNPVAPIQPQTTAPPVQPPAPQYQAPVQPPAPQYQAPVQLPAPQYQAPVQTPKIIPAKRDNPAGLQVDSFLPGVGQQQVSDADVLKQVLEPHHSMCGIMTNRLTIMGAVHTLWRKGDFRESVLLMCKMKDSAVAVDLLKRAQIKSAKDFTLDMAVDFLPLMQELLSSRYEDYIVVALEMSGILLKGFSSLIKMTRATFSQGGQVDISKEERLEKCNKCFQMFGQIEGTTRNLAKHDGRVGTVAQELLRGFDGAKLS